MTIAPLATSLSSALSSAILSIVPTSHPSGTSRISSSCIIATTNDAPADAAAGVGSEAAAAETKAQYSTTGYYSDSSGRAKIRLALRLDFGGVEEIRNFVDSGCLVPPPPSSGFKEDDNKTGGDGDNDKEEDDKQNRKERKGRKKKSNASLRFECAPTHESYTNISVEAITVLSTHVDTSDPEDCAILFEVELSIRSTADADDTDESDDDTDDEENDPSGGSMENVRGTSKMESNGASNIRCGSVGGEGVIQIRAVLSERVPTASGSRSATRQTGKSTAKVPLGLLALELGGGHGVPASRPSRSTAIAASADAPSTVHYSTLQTRTGPVHLRLNLVEPLIVTVREVGAARAASGATLVSVTVSHSNVHDEDVTVTNLAIHPGHSRPWDPAMAAAEARQQQQQGRMSTSRSHSSTSRGGGSGAGNAGQMLLADDGYSSPSGSHVYNTSILAGPNAVVDMLTSVRWGYAPGTAPSLPLVLKPRESVATVLQIDAGENLKTRGYVSPVAVTAVVGDKKGGTVEVGADTGGNSAAAGGSDKRGRLGLLAVPSPVPVMVSTDARWTTGKLAVEPADAFRVDLSLAGSGTTCQVGAPVVVGLRVMNLSNEPKDLMLLMAKDEESSRDKEGGLGFRGLNRRRRERYGNSGASVSGGASVVTSGSTPLIGGRPYSQTAHGVNTAVVSEVNGYTFGVWGLSGDDDGTSRHNRDHELLAVDAALLLGEVKGQHAIEAELRFVPLREGTLDVPNLKLYDKLGGRWYNCVHLLKIVAKAANEA